MSWTKRNNCQRTEANSYCPCSEGNKQEECFAVNISPGTSCFAKFIKIWVELFSFIYQCKSVYDYGGGKIEVVWGKIATFSVLCYAKNIKLATRGRAVAVLKNVHFNVKFGYIHPLKSISNLNNLERKLCVSNSVSNFWLTQTFLEQYMQRYVEFCLNLASKEGSYFILSLLYLNYGGQFHADINTRESN